MFSFSGFFMLKLGLRYRISRSLRFGMVIFGKYVLMRKILVFLKSVMCFLL